jgi:hypothetical protein
MENTSSGDLEEDTFAARPPEEHELSAEAHDALNLSRAL